MQVPQRLVRQTASPVAAHMRSNNATPRGNTSPVLRHMMFNKSRSGLGDATQLRLTPEQTAHLATLSAYPFVGPALASNYMADLARQASGAAAPQTQIADVFTKNVTAPKVMPDKNPSLSNQPFIADQVSATGNSPSAPQMPQAGTLPPGFTYDLAPQIPPELIYGGLALAGLLFVMEMRKS